MKTMGVFWNPRRGFTIIELLVVIAIIAILLGLLLPTIAAIRARAKITATTTLIKGIEASLQRYYVDFDEYPPSTVADLGGTNEPGSLYKYLCGPDGRGITRIDGTKSTKYEPYMVIPPDNLKLLADGNYAIIDSWGRDIVYLNCRAYTQEKRDGNPAYDPRTDTATHNHNSFDVYSLGPNRQKDDPYVDDIINWTR